MGLSESTISRESADQFRIPTCYHRGAMEYDQDKVDEMVLALLYLTTFDDRPGWRAWKSHDWDVLDRLHAKGYISDPKSKPKSVVVTEEGAHRSRELFDKHFGK